MISIFDDRPFQAGSGDIRDAYIQRLQEIAGYAQVNFPAPNTAAAGPHPTGGGAAGAGAAPAPAAEVADRDSCPEVGHPDASASGAAIEDTKTEVMEAATTSPANGSDSESAPEDDLQRLTQRITPILAEALAAAVRELSQYTAGDRQLMKASLSAFHDLSKQLQGVSAELTLLHQKLARVEERLQLQEAAWQQFADRASQFEDARKSLERRLEVQAGAIRALHATASDRGDRREEFRLALRKLEEILGAFSVPAQLPDGL